MRNERKCGSKVAVAAVGKKDDNFVFFFYSNSLLFGGDALLALSVSMR